MKSLKRKSKNPTANMKPESQRRVKESEFVTALKRLEAEKQFPKDLCLPTAKKVQIRISVLDLDTINQQPTAVMTMTMDASDLLNVLSVANILAIAERLNLN